MSSLSKSESSLQIAKVDMPYSASILSYFQLEDENQMNEFTTESSRYTCPILGIDCNYKFSLVKMRNHIGKHILNKSTPPNVHMCGFCGSVGCSISIKVTSGFGVNATYGPESDCKFYIRFSLKKKKKVIDSYPCSNRPVVCDHCKKVFWSYNMKLHYGNTHPGIDCPEMITEEEILKVKACR